MNFGICTNASNRLSRITRLIYYLRMSSSKNIDISGLSQEEVVKVLWENSTPPKYYEFYNLPFPEYDAIKATEAINLSGGRLDYVCGHMIKADFLPDGLGLDCSGYDRIYGEGSCWGAVNDLKSNKQTNK